jgi:hypothetical protein
MWIWDLDTEIAVGREQWRTVETSQGVSQGCPLSSTLIDMCVDNFVKEWLTNLKNYFYTNQNIVDTILLSNCWAVIPQIWKVVAFKEVSTFEGK